MEILLLTQTSLKSWWRKLLIKIPLDLILTLMRYRTNYEKDEILKKRMIENGIADRIEWIVDDRQRVVDMWRNNGFNVLQCRQWKEKE